MAMHKLPSGRSIGPGGRLYKGGNRRRHIVSRDGPSVPNTGGTIGRRSGRSGVPKEEGQGSPRGWVSRGKRRGY